MPTCISIVIPTHNRADALHQTLLNLKKVVFKEGWEVVVVNNNCTDNTDEVVKEHLKDFPVSLLLLKEEKRGAAAARNTGVYAAKGQYIVFIDNDILVQPDFLTLHYKNLQQGKESWFIGHMDNLPEQEQTHFGKFRKSLVPPAGDSIVEVDLITGQNTSLLRDQFVELGGFDENFHVASGEDRELALRAIRSGIKIYVDPSIVVKHNDWAGTSIRDYCERQRYYTLTEPFFWKKYGNETPRLKTVKENLPPSLSQDGLRLSCWKITKGILGSKIGQRLIVGMCGVCERVLPRPFILWRLYRLAIAGAIYKGFNEGLVVFSVNQKELRKALP